MSLQLEHDSSSPVQEHLNELTARVTLILFLASLTTIAWLTQVDAILDLLLGHLNPCVDDCLNLFDPARWSAIRWMTAAILGIISVMPMVLYQVWKFSKPGLLPAERKWMKYWFFTVAVGMLITVVSTIGVLFPMMFDTGHQTHESMQLDARYDAVQMLSIVIAVIWTEMIVTCAILAMMLAGVFGMLNEESADWWRTRIYGISLLLLLASLPEFGGLAVFLGAISVAFIELCSTKWLHAPVPLFMGHSSIMDSEGGIRNVLLVDCACSGAALPIPQPLNSKIPVLSAYSLCSSNSEREALLETAMQHRLTDIIISGCSSEPLPNSFKSNCLKLGCNLRGLDLLQTQSHRTLPSPFSITEIELKIASLVDPWPSSKIPQRIFSILENSNVRELVIDTRRINESWGMQMKTDQVLLTLDAQHSLQLMKEIEPLGIKTTLL
tara:strand:+ start:16990 stop:18306 length:1317 start_codon:yes stop_codon:yes gene_type:complete